MQTLAKLNGESAKAWWTELSEDDRKRVESRESYEAFKLGWAAAKLRCPSTTIKQYYLVMPADLNHVGTMFGGVAMNLADKYGAICGSLAYPDATFVTRHFDIFNFLSPAHLGDILEITATLLETGNTSITVGIDAVNTKSRSKIFSTKAVYVNILNGIKAPIPTK